MSIERSFHPMGPTSGRTGCIVSRVFKKGCEQVMMVKGKNSSMNLFVVTCLTTFLTQSSIKSCVKEMEPWGRIVKIVVLFWNAVNLLCVFLFLVFIDIFVFLFVIMASCQCLPVLHPCVFFIFFVFVLSSSLSLPSSSSSVLCLLIGFDVIL